MRPPGSQTPFLSTINDFRDDFASRFISDDLKIGRGRVIIMQRRSNYYNIIVSFLLALGLFRHNAFNERRGKQRIYRFMAFGLRIYFIFFLRVNEYWFSKKTFTLFRYDIILYTRYERTQRSIMAKRPSSERYRLFPRCAQNAF